MSEFIFLVSCTFVYMCINKINCIFVFPFDFCVNLSLNIFGYLSYFYYIREYLCLVDSLLLKKTLLWEKLFVVYFNYLIKICKNFEKIEYFIKTYVN